VPPEAGGYWAYRRAIGEMRGTLAGAGGTTETGGSSLSENATTCVSGTSYFAMRNAVAAAILIALVVPVGLPLAIPAPESTLPACCRRDGRHHCAMLLQYEASRSKQQGGTRAESTPEPCPFRSALFAPSARHGTGIPLHSIHYAGLVSHPAEFVQDTLAARISEARVHWKRGPPALLD
jgi:hypothetical protein